MFGRAIFGFLIVILIAAKMVAQRPDLAGSMAIRMPEPFVVDSSTLASPGWVRPISPAIIPGSGQLMASQDRGVVYLAVEAFLVIQLISSSGEGTRERDRYKDLAFTIARAPFAPARRDTTFEYFEQMERFIESGPFDTEPSSSLVPPTDELTYNGSIWRLARETFLADPVDPDTSSTEYQSALAFYRERAIGPNFQWSWRDAGLEQDLYRQSIKRSDDAFRSSTQYLGLLLANHLLSAIDAFVSYRLSENGTTAQLQSSLRRIPGSYGAVEATVGLRFIF